MLDAIQRPTNKNIHNIRRSKGSSTVYVPLVHMNQCQRKGYLMSPGLVEREGRTTAVVME